MKYFLLSLLFLIPQFSFATTSPVWVDNSVSTITNFCRTSLAVTLNSSSTVSTTTTNFNLFKSSTNVTGAAACYHSRYYQLDKKFTEQTTLDVTFTVNPISGTCYTLGRFGTIDIFSDTYTSFATVTKSFASTTDNSNLFGIGLRGINNGGQNCNLSLISITQDGIQQFKIFDKNATTSSSSPSTLDVYPLVNYNLDMPKIESVTCDAGECVFNYASTTEFYTSPLNVFIFAVYFALVAALFVFLIRKIL